MKKLIYTTSTVDPVHLDQLKVFLHTLWTNGKERTPLRLDLINANNIQGLEKLYPNIEIFHGFPIKIKGGNSSDVPELSQFEVDSMYSRPIGMQAILQEPYDMVLSIDTDIIIRKPIGGIWEGDWDLNLYFREKRKDHLKFQGGLIVYRNSAKVRMYYDQFIEDIRNYGSKVYSCQEAMYRLALKNDIKIGKLPQAFNDSQFSHNSAVWHVKHSHLDKKEWQKSFRKNLEAANARIASAG
jgi:hypothetical protein